MVVAILLILYIAFYPQPGRIKAARKVGAGEAEALREKVKADFQGKYSDNYIFKENILTIIFSRKIF